MQAERQRLLGGPVHGEGGGRNNEMREKEMEIGREAGEMGRKTNTEERKERGGRVCVCVCVCVR